MPTSSDLMGLGMDPFLSGALGNDPLAVTAAGTISTTATLMKSRLAIVTAASNQTGVILPTVSHIGSPWYIIGVGSAAPVIYPHAGGTINGTTSLTLSGATATAVLIRASSTQWFSFPLAP